MIRVISLVVPLCFMALYVVPAQEKWYIPQFSVSAYITPEYSTDNGEFNTHVLAAVSANLNKGGLCELGITYDLVKNCFVGGEFIYRPFRQFSVKAGIQRMPYLLETTYSPRYLEAVGYSLSALYLGGYSKDISGVNSRSRDCGLAFEGSFFPKDGYSVVTYTAGIFNGNGYKFKDDNKAKNIEGRIIIQPTAHLKFSIGGMKGWCNGPDGLASRDRLSVACWYVTDKTFIRSENILGKTGITVSNGFYLMGGRWISDRIALAVRYNSVIMDFKDRSQDINNIEACLTWRPPVKNFSFRLQYGHFLYGHKKISDKGLVSACLIIRL